MRVRRERRRAVQPFRPWRSGLRPQVPHRRHSPRTPCERLLDRDDVSDLVKQSLRVQLSQLDPVSLLSEIRSAQQRLADLSVGGISVQPNDDNITGFMKSLASAWKTGEVRPTHKPSDTKTRTWRTRPDPFESDGSTIAILRVLFSSVAKGITLYFRQMYFGRIFFTFGLNSSLILTRGMSNCFAKTFCSFSSLIKPILIRRYPSLRLPLT